MASSLYFTRRIKIIITSPTSKLLSILLFFLLSIRWVLRHNHDDAPTYATTLHISVDDSTVDWFKMYYVTYVRTTEELCSALMVWSEIELIGSRAQRMLFYPADWAKDELDDSSSQTKQLTPRARLLQSAEAAYYVKLAPLDILSSSHREYGNWAGRFTKLLAFNLTEFSRVLVISPDSTVLQNLDELFLFPSSLVAMPWVYSSKRSGAVGWGYSSQLLMVEPSTTKFKAVEERLGALSEQSNIEDTSVLLSLGSRAPLRIPQRPYHLPTSSFRLPYHLHSSYLTTYDYLNTWDPERILSEAKILQFDDIGVAKPWRKERRAVMNKYMPRCRVRQGFGATECSDREVWLGVYRRYAARREAVCGVGFEVVGDESEREGEKGGSVDGKEYISTRREARGLDYLN